VGSPSLERPALPLDSEAGEAPAPDPARARKTKLRRRIKKWLGRLGIGVVARVLPALYCAYMWFVYKTSRVEHVNTDLLPLLRDRYGGLVGIMWHQEVFMVAWSFRQYEGHTVASTSDLGKVITGLLKVNGFTVFRGGSSARHKRQRVLPAMIEHMQTVPGVAYGITCDGPVGPPYRVRAGSIRIAHATHKPILVARTWCKRRIDLKTWDHAFLPLPFNHIVQAFAGPYFAPVDADDPAALERFRREVETELLELTHYVHRRIGDPPTPDGRFGFPEGWTPTWGDELPARPIEVDDAHPASRSRGALPVRARARREQRRAVARARERARAARDRAAPTA